MSDSDVVQSGDPNDNTYWYDTATGTVEHGRIAPGPDRLGPFATAAEAENALETVRRRSEAWASEDAADDDW